MNSTPIRIAAAWVGLLSAAGMGSAVAAETAVAFGSFGGTVTDVESGAPLSGVTIEARDSTGDERRWVVTDARGAYQVDDAPAAVYNFTLSHGGHSYPIPEPLDARLGMPFVVEGCFALDQRSKTATILPGDCDSGLVPEIRVASIGAQRFLLPVNYFAGLMGPGGQEEEVESLSDIEHVPPECLPNDFHPLLDAVIEPGEQVQTSRVYFRSDKYEDFYYVEMTGTEDDFRALLPIPSPETERIIYYMEAIDGFFENVTSEQYAPVIEAGEECKKRGPAAWFTGEDPNIVIGATAAGQAAIPPGFQAVGITTFVTSAGVATTVAGTAAAVGGGLGATGIAVVVAAPAIAGGTIVVNAGDKQESSPPD